MPLLRLYLAQKPAGHGVKPLLQGSQTAQVGVGMGKTGFGVSSEASLVKALPLVKVILLIIYLFTHCFGFWLINGYNFDFFPKWIL